jgi:hypothetical protein
MAAIDISSAGGGGSVSTGVLQLQNGVAMDSTLRNVSDQNDTTSPLKLSTTSVQIESPLRITTSDASGFYLDCEDGSTNNRFSIKRLPAAQEVSLDFASNPVQTDALVGTIRTYRDGVSLSETMSFLKDGTIGIGTTTPNASSLVEISSTTKGFLPPRMTNAQKNAITSPAEGLIVHDTTNNGVAYYDGSTWGYLSGAKQTLTGSGGTLNIPFRNGNIVDLTLVNPNIILTLTAHVVGTYIFKVTQGGVGNCTITWPASVKWTLGVAPTLSTAVGKVDIITLFHDGTNFYGTYSLNY